mmetsp:Transcript_10514/g.14573  ORF Transcript_10514/g.14573 Transcript_10514/m.14573 type:complete len:205 (+) Transcript_10514:282-896(+)
MMALISLLLARCFAQRELILPLIASLPKEMTPCRNSQRFSAFAVSFSHLCWSVFLLVLEEDSLYLLLLQLFRAPAGHPLRNTSEAAPLPPNIGTFLSVTGSLSGLLGMPPLSSSRPRHPQLLLRRRLALRSKTPASRTSLQGDWRLSPRNPKSCQGPLRLGSPILESRAPLSTSCIDRSKNRCSCSSASCRQNPDNGQIEPFPR